MIEFLASDTGIRTLAYITLGLVVLGVLLSVFYVLPRATKSLRVGAGLKNGRRIFAWFQMFMGCGGLIIYFLFGTVATVLLTLPEGNVRSATARVGILFVLILIVIRDVATPYTMGRMDRSRTKSKAEQKLEVIDERTADTNATAHRIEDCLEEGRGQDASS